MADKVLRFTAEDSGYSAAIDRMAGKLRDAFSSAGLSDILSEADDKFTNLQDKLKYIQSQLISAREKLQTSKNDDALGYDPKGRFNFTNEDVIQRRYGALPKQQAQQEEKSINRLIQSLDHLGEKVEEANEKEREGSGGGGGEQPPAPPKPPAPGGGGGFIDLLNGSLQTAFGFGIERIAEKMYTIARDFIKNMIQDGTQLARSENQQRTFTPFNENAIAPYELGVNNKEYIEARGRYALSRRSGANIDNETLNRLRLLRSNGAVTDEQISGLDKFYRVRPGGGLLDRSNMDATRTISEIIARAERQGILGVSKGDFTMLPEKIGQVTSIMQQQYQSSERTNANSAINLLLAGNRIGGRFADDRASDTFGRLSEGISNPRSPGMRAFVLEALRRANPGTTSPLALEGIMQEGLSNEGNTKAIFGALQNVRSREARGRILQSMGLDAQSAYRLANTDNLQAFLQQANKGGLSTEEYRQFQGATQQKAETATLNTDKMGSYFSNAVSAFGEAVVQFVNGVKKQEDQTGTKPQPGISANKIIPAGGGR